MDTERGCLLPLAQSVISGILAGLVAGAVGMWQEWQGAGYIALLVGAVVALFVWAGGLGAWRRSVYAPAVYYPPEQEDQPDQAPARVRVEVSQTEGAAHTTQIADLPVSVDQLAQLAVGLLAGQTFAEGVWTGAGRPFSKSEFIALRSEFIKRGWACWKNDRAPAQGVSLTRPGAAVMRSFASEVGTLPHQVKSRR